MIFAAEDVAKVVEQIVQDDPHQTTINTMEKFVVLLETVAVFRKEEFRKLFDVKRMVNE